MPSPDLKFKRLRLLLEDLRCRAHGWHGNFVSLKSRKGDTRGWHPVVNFPMRIRVRPELDEQNINRIDNMKLCAQLIDGLHLAPGTIFSLQRIVGDPLPGRGFKIGPTILRGKLGSSAGGGLCQISTALFNLALLANLEILEKWNHSTDIWGENRLIDLGRDAVYVYGLKDLKFRNSLGADIVIRMELNAEQLLLDCRIESSRAPGFQVELQHAIIQELAPADRFPASGSSRIFRKGWVVLTERRVIDHTGSRVTYRKRERYRPCVLPGGNSTAESS